MLILALDSAGSSCGVCVFRNGTVLASAYESMQRGQDARLMPMVVEAMEKASCAFSDLARIAVTTGPGSFTGVRVGLAAARGIGLAAGRPVIGIDRFSIYKELNKAQKLLVVIDSKRAELFCKVYPTGEIFMMTQAEIDAFLAAHPGMETVRDKATDGADILPVLANLAAKADIKNPAYLPRPLYIRAPDVTFPKEVPHYA